MNPNRPGAPPAASTAASSSAAAPRTARASVAARALLALAPPRLFFFLAPVGLATGWRPSPAPGLRDCTYSESAPRSPSAPSDGSGPKPVQVLS